MSIGLTEKRMFEFLEAPIHQHFKKYSCSENFWKLPSKTSMLESFLITLGSFSNSCSEQLFCREPVPSCFCKKEPHSTHYLKSFSLQFECLKFTKKKLLTSKKHTFKNLVSSSFLAVFLRTISLQLQLKGNFLKSLK